MNADIAAGVVRIRRRLAMTLLNQPSPSPETRRTMREVALALLREDMPRGQ